MNSELKAIIILTVLSFAIGIYSYPQLPAMSASHWDLAGDADGYLPSVWAAFQLPAISAILAVLFVFIPRIDPLRKNIEAFRKDYYRFCLAVLLFLFFVYAQSILWNLGTLVSFNLTMPVLLGVLFIYLGTFLEKTKPNWFIGIRTPWTMSSPEVWDETHRLGSMLFKAAGIVSVFSVFLQPFGILISVAMVIASAVATVVYSYVTYIRIEKQAKEVGIKKTIRKSKRD